jgi:hypothetical protein
VVSTVHAASTENSDLDIDFKSWARTSAAAGDTPELTPVQSDLRAKREQLEREATRPVVTRAILKDSRVRLESALSKLIDELITNPRVTREDFIAMGLPPELKDEQNARQSASESPPPESPPAES